MGDNNEALVSIIMPAYNSEEFISKAINSVINQTYKNWELIVVNDCSTDKTDNLIKEYKIIDSRIRYYKLDINSGAAVARNKAIDISDGKFLAFLDSDDLWVSNKLTKQVRYMEENDFGFTCTSYTKIDEEGKSLGRTIMAKKKSDYNDILKTCPGNSTVMYNAQKLGKFKILDIKKRNDYVMWLQVIKEEEYLYGIKDALASHRINNNGISNNKKSLLKYHWYIYRRIEKISFLKSSYLLIYWVVVTMFKLRSIKTSMDINHE